MSSRRKVQYKLIETNKILPGRFQLRENATEEIGALVDSIKNKGLLQPICVIPVKGGKYEIIYGHRRYMAARLAGLKEVPCQIKNDIFDDEIAKLALIENLQRKNLNPIDEAKAYKMMIKEFKYTQEEVASLAGKPHRESIAQALQLLKLPKEIQDGVNLFTISPRHARILLRIKNKELQVKAYYFIIAHELSVRQTEEFVKRMMKLKKKEVREDDEAIASTFDSIASWLSRGLGTEVNIREFKKKRKLELSFWTDDDLMQIVNRFSKLKLRKSDLKRLKKKHEKEVSKALDEHIRGVSLSKGLSNSQSKRKKK